MSGGVFSVGRQRFTNAGWTGVACLLTPAVFGVWVAFQQASAWDDYARTTSLNGAMSRLGLNQFDANLPSSLPITVWAVMGLVTLIGAILVLVGREVVHEGSISS